IWLDAVLTGLSWPGLNLALFNLALGTAPDRNRTSYLAVQVLLSGLTGALGAAFGGLLAHGMDDRSWTAGPLRLLPYHGLFILTAILRIALFPLALRLHEDRARTFSELVRTVGDKATKLFSDGLESGLAFLRRRNPPR
ncbi:MAG: hypothetical protein U1E27_11325, partial [Kiritimatiellia bacterium]|nr:hypothetical protein [Kiritimatiellia bacterium]